MQPQDERDLLGWRAVVGASAVVRAALDGLLDTDDPRTWFDAVRQLAGAQRLQLGLAMDLAWLAARDPEDLGFSTRSAFYAERVDWGASWRKAMVALARSQLDRVKRAALDGTLPLRRAVEAPGALGPEASDEAQRAWLDTAAEPVDKPSAAPKASYEGQHAARIREARSLARICMGRAASDQQVDDFLLRHFREQTPTDQILAEARERPEPPPPAPPLSWDWCPWEAPADVADALARLQTRQAILRGRTATLARAWVIARHEAWWTCLPEPDRSPEGMARSVFGVSLRQAQRWHQLGWALQWHPELCRAIDEGLHIGSAAAIASVLGEGEVGPWLAVAARLGRRELLRAVADARAEGSRRTMSAYGRAIELADGATTSAGPDPRCSSRTTAHRWRARRCGAPRGWPRRRRGGWSTCSSRSTPARGR